MFTVEFSDVILPANEDDVVAAVLLVSVIDAAKEELAVLMPLDKVSNRNAADELLVVTVPCRVVIELAKDELLAFTDEEILSNLVAIEELLFTTVLFTEVIVAASEELLFVS